MLEERIHRLREVGMLISVCYVKLKKTQQSLMAPGEPMFVSGTAAVLKGSAMPVVYSLELTVGRDAAIKLGFLMGLILF